MKRVVLIITEFWVPINAGAEIAVCCEGKIATLF